MVRVSRDTCSASPPFSILHVLFSSRIAGSERYCADLANGQASLGHNVHVAGVTRSPIASLLSDKVSYHGMRLPFLRGLALRHLIAETSFDVCHAHLSHGCKALARLPHRFAKIATLHVGYKPGQHASLDGLICVNQTQSDHLGDYQGQRRVISNWLPETMSAEPVDLRRQLKIPAGTKLIGAVGRLHRSKGYDVLISAFRQAADDRTALVLIGEGPQHAELLKVAGGDPRIHLLGHRDDVSALLPNLDLFVSPSREETFGLAILEAMEHGLPIISTATEGPSQYLRNYPATLVEPGETKALALALADALRIVEIEGSRRIEYDMRPFSRPDRIADVLKFYSDVICQLKGDDRICRHNSYSGE